MTNLLIAITTVTLILLLQLTPISSMDRAVEKTVTRNYQMDEALAYDPSVIQSELDSHRSQWDSFVGEAKNYDMTLERICFCHKDYRGPFVMRIRNGEVQSAKYLSDTLRGSSTNPDLLNGLLTVDGVFGQIQNALDRSYVEIKVTYDDTTGYPTSFYSNMSQMIADGDTTYKITNVILNDNRDEESIKNAA